jgi:glutathione S-transferase
MLDGRLADNEFVCGPGFTVADITGVITIDFAGWGKIKPPEQMPHLHRWRAAVSARPSAKA